MTGNGLFGIPWKCCFVLIIFWMISIGVIFERDLSGHLPFWVLNFISSILIIFLIGKLGIKFEILLMFVAAIGILLGFICLGYGVCSKGNSKTFTNPVTESVTKNASKTARRYYHGTTREAAMDIFHSGLWMVGESIPKGIYVADNFSIAKSFSSGDRAIVEIIIAHNIPLQKRFEGAFFFEIPGAEPFKDYYRIDGFTPVSVRDADGNKIL